MSTPTPDELAAAFEDGAPVRFGLPVYARLSGGGWAALDLAGAARGKAHPWTTAHYLAPGVVSLWGRDGRSVWVADLEVSADDLGAVEAACAAAPGPEARHGPEADRARLEAGRIALRVRDAMVRARLLDAVDGWAALEDEGDVVDRDRDHGVLVAPPEELDLACRVVVVKCPSTGRRYAHCVPGDLATAREARLWLMDLDDAPEVET